MLRTSSHKVNGKGNCGSRINSDLEHYNDVSGKQYSLRSHAILTVFTYREPAMYSEQNVHSLDLCLKRFVFVIIQPCVSICA